MSSMAAPAPSAGAPLERHSVVTGAHRSGDAGEGADPWRRAQVGVLFVTLTGRWYA